MTYARKRLDGPPILPAPPAGPLEALRPMRRQAMWPVVMATDRAVVLSRRIVARWMADGTDLSPTYDNGTNPPGGTQLWPLPTRELTLCRSRVRITPGCMLELRGLVYRSGMQARYSAPNWYPDRPGGKIKVSITWTDPDGGTETTVATYAPATATHPQTADDVPGGAAGVRIGALAGARWRDLDRISMPLAPASVLPGDAAAVRRWSRPGTWADITISVVGGARPVDLVVVERPHDIAWRTTGDTVDPVPPVGIHHDSQRASTRYPWVARSTAVDTAGAYRAPMTGTTWLADVCRAQEDDLVPVLAHWHSWDPLAYTVTQTSQTLSVSSTTWPTYSASEPGYSIACGPHGARWDQHDLDQHGGTRAVVPVRLDVWASSSGGTGYVRLDTGASRVGVTVTSPTVQRVTGWGWLDSPRGPSGLSIVQAQNRVSAGTMQVSAWCLSVDTR